MIQSQKLKKQENGENQEISIIEHSYETIIEKDTKKYNRYAQIRKTETKYETKKQTKKYQSKLENIYGSTLSYIV